MSFMNGVLIIDKPAGMTSHDVVGRARRILRERRIGHTGTLDPFATGVLVLLVGHATRLAQFLSGADKEYEAVIRLGYATDTGDLEGTPLSSTRVELKRLQWPDDQIQTSLQQLCGETTQVPPMYSAKKYGGRRLYELARRGEAIERQPVCVTVHAFEARRTGEGLLKDNQDGTVDLAVRVVCSAGTYVRTLAEDFGKLLGVGAHLAELRRTRAGDFLVTNAVTLEQLQQSSEEGSIGTILLPADSALSRMPFVHLTTENAQKARHGNALSVHASDWLEGEKVRMKDGGGNLIGIGYYDRANQLLHPRVVLTSENID
jgi:tRNA pseudouridine55 synthase